MNGSNVWGSLAPYGDALPFVQMEYLQMEYFPFKTGIIANCHLEFSYFLPVLFSTSWS